MTMQTRPERLTPDPASLRQTLSCFPTGVAIVTTRARSGVPIGVTISSFNSVSMDPPLILWSLAKTAGSLPEFTAYGSFAINILAEDQAGHCRLFSSKERDRFAQLDWHEGAFGLPVLDGCAAVLECTTYAIHPGGDHEILLGQVVAHAASDRAPLVFGKGRLGGLKQIDAA